VTPHSVGRCHAVTEGTASVRGRTFPQKGFLPIITHNLPYKHNGRGELYYSVELFFVARVKGHQLPAAAREHKSAVAAYGCQ